jgi:hypothetical protein
LKRVIVSACIIAAAVLYGILAAVYAKYESDEITAMTLRIGEFYEEYALTGDEIKKIDALLLSEQLEKKAEQFENGVSLFVRDERLSTLEYAAARIKHLIHFNSDEVAAELENIREQVETIAESERPYWYNIL